MTNERPLPSLFRNKTTSKVSRVLRTALVRKQSEIMADIKAAYAELETDARKHFGMGRGFIEDRITTLWIEYDNCTLNSEVTP